MAKEKIELKADQRQEKGKKNKKLRAAGLVPAVVYGRKFKPTAVALDLKEYQKKVLRSEAGHNLLFTLMISGEGKGQSVPVITQSVQYDPLTGRIEHIDFKHLVMDEKIKTKVPVELNGLPVGVKEEGGVLVHGLREIEIKCLPGDIPDKFEIDVAAMIINSSLRVSDLKIGQNIEILSDQNEMIANVSPPTKEEEVVAQPVLGEEGAVPAAEGAAAVAAEAVKEKAAPGAAPAEKPAREEKK